MAGRRALLLAVAVLALIVPRGGASAARPAGIPDRLSNQEFWKLSSSFS